MKINNFINQGIKTSFDEIKKYIDSYLKKIEKYGQDNVLQTSQLPKVPDKLIFEQISEKKDLILPMLFRALIDKSNPGDNAKFIESIYNEYINFENYKPFLNQINSIPDIPVEILSNIL